MLIIYTKPRPTAARHVQFGDYIAHRRGNPGMRPAMLDAAHGSGWGLKPDDEWARVCMTSNGGHEGTTLAYRTSDQGEAYRVAMHPDQVVIVCERYELEPWDVDGFMRACGRPGARVNLGNVNDQTTHRVRLR